MNSIHNIDEIERNRKAIKVLNDINKLKIGDEQFIEPLFKITNKKVDNLINSDINLDLLKRNIQIKQNILKNFK
jgi:hypothetical protein